MELHPISDSTEQHHGEVASGARRRLHPELRGLLASSALHGQPVKGVYFFPGERGINARTYTTHPLDSGDEHWNSVASTRAWVVERMAQAHVNTVVMSYWGNMPDFSPMQLDPPFSPLGVSPSWIALLDAIQGRPMVVMPAIESGYDANHPEKPHWVFSSEFPINPGGFELAHGLVERIGWLLALFEGRMNLWARIYDREGRARYAVNLLHVASDLIDQDAPGADDTFAHAFDIVAAEVMARYRIPIGFTLDAVGGKGQRYSPYPDRAGAALERTASVLAMQGFASEVFSDQVRNAPPCEEGQDWRTCPAHDNNLDNLEHLADWKRDAVRAWIHTGVPVILDVSNGFDGRVMWATVWHGFWGDNLDYTDDRWRNWLSQLKGPGVRGITFNTWNGYTEGYAAVASREHGWTVYNWLRDLLEPLPWHYSHMHYVDGAPTHRVYGAICEKWIQLGADRGFGAPVSAELPSALGRMQYFADGKAIYWSAATQAHELHGSIAMTYREEGADASCLGLPVSDEQVNGAGRICYFQHGRIEWYPGDLRGRVVCV
jgi:LGFP repeat